VPLLISRSAGGAGHPHRGGLRGDDLRGAAHPSDPRRDRAHFGIFVLLAFLVLYCDWRPLVAAAALIAVHHLSFAWLQATGAGVYVFPEFDGVGGCWCMPPTWSSRPGCCATSRAPEGLVQDGMTVSSFALRVADGHLDYAFDPKQLESRPLLAAVARMQDELRSTVSEARNTADSLRPWRPGCRRLRGDRRRGRRTAIPPAPWPPPWRR
jgi:hypothetical protein